MRPSYSELTSGASRVNGSAWGLWGDDDEIGALNDVTPAHVAAAALVQRGAVFSLNWDLELPSPGLFSRGRCGTSCGTTGSAWTTLNVRGGVGSTANALALK
jgi:hypothetical protein